MQIAIFSDVHGNPYACEAVLDAIEEECQPDAIVAAGDLCLGGSDPAKCIDLLMSAGAVGVCGNTERYIRMPERIPDDEPHRRKWDVIQPVAYWVRDQLSPRQMDWLMALPFEMRFSPGGEDRDDLLVVHANPKDLDFNIYPPVGEQNDLWGEVRQPDNDPILSRYLEGVLPGVIAFGHFHYPFIRLWEGKRLVNVACCSLPGIDYDLRARYSIFTWENREWNIVQRSVRYDVEREIAALEAGDMPSKEAFIQYFGENP